jgi:WD40 repeat protein/3',5'-cyclic AMP phosphodiesterase CpdA
VSDEKLLEPPRFASDEPAITILHVSDMQFGKHHRFADEGGGFNTLLRRLCDDLDLLKRENGLVPDLVALTGDLAEWGMKSEFEQVAQFAEGLLRHLALEPDRLLIVPGNHDINRKLCEAYFNDCEGEGEAPKAPYWRKWKPFVELFQRLYRDVERYRFTELEPWTLFEIPALKVVVAGMNSTLHESHREADHHGFVGEAQLRWFSDRLEEYERRGWLRVGLVHHNAVRRAAVDDENLKDADDLREVLGERLHVLLHGHTHQGRLEMLGPSLPVISTGSAAVKRDQRPGPSQDQPGETPNQYQLVRLTRAGLWCAARQYTYERKRWIGDTRVSKSGDRAHYSLDRTWPRADATFPPPVLAADRRAPARSGSDSGEPLTDGATDDPAADDHTADDHVPDDYAAGDHAGAWRSRTSVPGRGHERERDLLDDVIDWCQIRGGTSIAKITRVSHRGPWGDYATVLDTERGLGLLGAYAGDLTPEVLDRWVADIHDPFRGRGQPVSKLVAATPAIDPSLRAAAQRRGVELERMIDYQRVLDTAGYAEKLRERLDRDREYPEAYYLEQRVTVWSPVGAHRERVERAADWLATQLREREGAFMLVLGPAGVGKTFLLRQVARRLGEQRAITPILIELRNLELAHSVEELAANQFTRLGVPWHPKAFRRDLEEGRLALLFDGFDELALRVRAAAIPAHFERIFGAAVERARIVVSSRTEHFASSGQVADLMTSSPAGATTLGGMLARVPRRQVLEVHPFERDDVAAYLHRRLGERAGEDRLTRLARVHDLVGLACNPRMLSFLVDIPDDKLAEAAGLGDSITSDALYRIVVEDAWLAAEAARLAPPGAAPGPTAEALRDAATNLALKLWRDPGGGLQVDDVGALLLRMCEDDQDYAFHTARSRTLLTRDDRGRIAFIHQTVLEWLVAGRLASEITGEVPGAHLDLGRLNTFMIELLRQRLGDDALAGWAQVRLAAPTTSVAAENAREVLKCLNREATEQAIHRGQDLRGQDFAGQSLRGAILDRADLTGARMIGRDLTRASLLGAQLAYADLTDACLRDADLTGANLAFARFHHADLEGAHLAGARLTGASFLGARNVSALASTSAIGVALEVPASIEAMFARALWGECRVALNPDGTVLASGHGDGTVCVWDCTRGQLLRILAGHSGRVLNVAFSPDGHILTSCDEDATVLLWNVADGSERARLYGVRGRTSSVAFSPDGKLVASGSADSTVHLWNVADGSERARLIGHRGRVLSVAFSPDGKLVATAGDDTTVRLWNVADGSERLQLTGHRTTLADLLVGKHRSGSERARLTAHRGIVWSVAFSPDSKMVASGGIDTTVRLWNVADGSELARLVGHRGNVLSVAFSPDGHTVASGAADATVRLWSVADRRERAQLIGHRGIIWSVAFSSDGHTIASGADDATLRLWSVADGRERVQLAASRGSVFGVAFAPDGHTIVSGDADATVRVWSVADGRERARASRLGGSVFGVAFSPDGRIVASGGAADPTVHLWNIKEDRELAQLTGHRGNVLSVAFSPDGHTIASSADDSIVRLWNTSDGRERAQLVGHQGRVFSVVFSPDGHIIASGADDTTVRLWNTANGCQRARLVGHHGSVLGVAFSPDGQTIASGAADATARLWNTADGSEQTQLVGHQGNILSVAFSPGGGIVATGATDASVRLWNMADGRELAQLTGHRGRVFSVAFSPDGQTVASGSADGTVRLWDVATGGCLAILYGTPGGTVAARPDGHYRVQGDVAGRFWHVIGLHRYEVGELDALIPDLRLADDEPLYTRP